MLKLLIAIDGSDPADHAIQTAARLAREGAVEAIMLNVRGAPGYYGELPPLDYPSLDAAMRREQDTLLAGALERARAAGLQTVHTVGTLGQPAQEIARVAADERVDQIVMGTRGMNPLGGLLLGSVAQRVVHLANVPVLLVK